jgi:hypothetical protein
MYDYCSWLISRFADNGVGSGSLLRVFSALILVFMAIPLLVVQCNHLEPTSEKQSNF